MARVLDMNKKKKVNLEDRATDDESEGLSMKIPIDQIEKLFSELTYKNLGEEIGNILSKVRKKYANDIGADGRFKHPDVVAKEITKGIAKEILPNLDVDDATTVKYVRELLSGKGIIYDQIKKTLKRTSVKDEVGFASKLRDQFANTIKESSQIEGQEHVAAYMAEQEGRDKMMGHVGGSAGIKWKKDSYVDAGDIINFMSAYMAQPGVFDEKGNVNRNKTKLADEILVEIGKDVMEGYDTVHDRHKKRLKSLHPGVKKKDQYKRAA